MRYIKDFFIDILRRKLRLLARLTIWRYRPGIVGVTGSVGKTSTKLAIAEVLASLPSERERESIASRRVRVSSGNMNNDLGLPLAILGDWSPRDLALVSRETPPGTARFGKLIFWLKVIFGSLWRIIKKTSNYPEIIILEYGADRPGDIKYLLRIARPNLSVITAVGDVPVHLEFYAGSKEVAREKGRLIECLPSAGFAILNHDDETVMMLAPRTRARVITYGFEKGAEMRIARFENWVEKEKPMGIKFKLEYGGNSVPVHIAGAFGKAQAYSAAAAASVGLIFGMNLAKISEALARYRPADSRMQLIPGVKYTYIIDDSYNASPLSMSSALESLRELPATRRIAVLGDMLEIGKYAPEAHENIGRLAAGIVDFLFTVGPRAKFIAEAARKARMKPANIFSFDVADEVEGSLQKLMQKGDVVLVKGSHAMELEKVVDAVKYIEPSSSSPV